MNIQNKKYRKGFTLIELLVCLFIVVLLTALFIPYYRQYGRRNELKTSIQEMREGILRAQSLAYAPQNPNATYYRFIFYPDTKKYEIRFGTMSFSSVIPANISESEPIAEGFLPKTVSYAFKAGEEPLPIINNKKQGTVVFQTISGKCNFWHNQSPIIFTFKNDYGDSASIEINNETCAINVK